MADKFRKYDDYAVAGSIYCYKDSAVLRNKLGIRDGKQLRRVETDISAARQAEMINHPVFGKFTTNHLCTIHRRLLGDVYPFAGHLRREDIAKGETRFLNHAAIRQTLMKLLDQLSGENYMAVLERDELIVRSAYYMAELHYIHPFREGNGRAIRYFMRLLFLHCGYQVDWGAVSVETLLQAMIDSVYDTATLELVLDRCLLEAD